MPNLPSLLAQAAASEETTGALNKAMEFFRDFFSSGAIGIFLEGGIFMWPILILLILVLAVVIERYRSLKMLEVDSSKLREEITELLKKKKVEESGGLGGRAGGPGAAGGAEKGWKRKSIKTCQKTPAFWTPKINPKSTIFHHFF